MSTMPTTRTTPPPATLQTAPWIAVVALGLFLIAHGVAHAVGAMQMWGLRSEDGRFNLDAAVTFEGPAATWMGVAWCLALVAMMVAGAVVLLRRPGAERVVAGATVVSTVLCLVSLPASFVGLIIDAVILVGLGIVAARRRRA